MSFEFLYNFTGLEINGCKGSNGTPVPLKCCLELGAAANICCLVYQAKIITKHQYNYA